MRRRIEVVLESFGGIHVDVARDEFAHWLQDYSEWTPNPPPMTVTG